MKYIKYLFISILLLPISVFAYEFKCDEKSEPYQYGDEFTCLLKGNAGTIYDEISGEIEKNSSSVLECSIEKIENGLTINQLEKNEGTSFSYQGALTVDELVKYVCKVAVKPTSSKLEQLVIPELKYDIKDDNKTATSEVVRSSSIRIQEYIETPVGDTKPRDTSNPNSRIKSIQEENNQLDFTFSAFKTIYNIEVKFEVELLHLVVVPDNSDASYKILFNGEEGNGHLELGDNVIDVYATSPDGTSTTCYTLNIKRLKRGEDIYYPEKNSELSELKVEGYTINFEPQIDTYKVHLPYNVDNLKVSAVAKESTSIVEISNTSDLRNGSTIEVKVTSEDGSNTTIYKINITKDAPPKDYRTLIYGGSIVAAIVLVIIIIIITNTRNKNNPLLRSKKKEVEINIDPVQSPQPTVTETPVVPQEVQVPVAPQPVQQPTVEVPVQPQAVQPPQVNVDQSVQPVEPNNISINQ